MKWFERSDIVSYIVECYVGTDTNASGQQVRQFVWEDEDGNIVIGNPRAFGEHVQRHFDLPERSTRWMDIHQALRAMGEVLFEKRHDVVTRQPGKRFRNQDPEVRILRRKKIAE